MTILWYDKNRDTSPQEMYANCQLAKNFSSFDDSRKAYFYLIAGNREIAMALLSSFKNLEDNFESLELRLGWMDNEKGKEKMYSEEKALNGKALLIGEFTDIHLISERKSVKTLHIASKASNHALHLGFQRHLGSNYHPGSISLGEIRADDSHAMTEVRKAEQIHFHINAVRAEDSGSKFSYTTGMDIYEACKLMRLAGLSRQLDAITINTAEGRLNQKTSDCIALIIWYFLEGRINKEIESMKAKENDIFLVSSEFHAEPIKFVVGHKTGRWWYQHPDSKEYLPCSDQDYKAIAQGQLPDAIMPLEAV